MTTTVDLTQRALRDIKDIDAYSIETFGQRVADEYIADINQGLLLLAEQPDLLSEKPGVSGRLVFHRVRRHFLVCDVIDGRIYVVTVIHAAMDLPSRIAELEPMLIHEAEVLHQKAQAAGKKKRRPKGG